MTDPHWSTARPAWAQSMVLLNSIRATTAMRDAQRGTSAGHLPVVSVDTRGHGSLPYTAARR